MEPNIGISEKNLRAVTDMLSIVLSDAMLLYIKTRKFHWNVNGESFMEYHKLFEGQYKQLEKAVDEIAERINKLGTPALGTMKEFISLSGIKEAPGKYPTSAEMVEELLSDHETIIKALRKFVDDCADKYSDSGTADFLTGLMEEHETIAWTLRRYFN
ncbi:MAG: DNA starvation/stationary phase protection protein [Ferruginibacter sp.]